MFETITTLLGAQLIGLGVGIVANMLSDGIKKTIDGVEYIMYNTITISVTGNKEATKNILKKIMVENPKCNKVMTSRNGKNKYFPDFGKYTITLGKIPVIVKYSATEIKFYQNGSRALTFLTRLPSYGNAFRKGNGIIQIFAFIVRDLTSLTDVKLLQNGVSGLKLTAAQSKTICFYSPMQYSDQWTLTTRIPYCNISGARITPEMKEIIADANKFVCSKTSYRSKGKHYRKCYLLYGESGTGKTKTANIVAEQLDRDVYCMDFGGNNMTDERFSALVLGVPKNSIIIFDEFDKSVARLNTFAGAPMDAGTILKALRGPIPLPDGVIVFITANSTDFLATHGFQHLVSKGRVDVIKKYKTRFGSSAVAGVSVPLPHSGAFSSSPLPPPSSSSPSLNAFVVAVFVMILFVVSLFT